MYEYGTSPWDLIRRQGQGGAQKADGGRFAGIPDAELTAEAEMLAQTIPFLRDTLGKLHSAAKRTARLGRLNEALQARGLDAVDPLTSLSPEQLRQAWMRYGTKSPKKAAQADIMLRQMALDTAREKLGEASNRVNELGLYPRVASLVLSQLEHPEVITDQLQRKIEGNIRQGANRASTVFERRLRDQLAGRGLPGTPAMSGPGIKSLGEFERLLSGETTKQITEAQLRQALANADYRAQLERLAAGLASSDPEMQLLRDRASLESGVSLSPSGVGFGDYASLLAAMEAAKKASSGGTSFADLLPSLISAGGRIGASLAAPAAAGSAAGAVSDVGSVMGALALL